MFKNTVVFVVFYLVLSSCSQSSSDADKNADVQTESQHVEKKSHTKENSDSLVTNNPSEKNEDMVYFEGGPIIIGSNDQMPNESPAFETKIEPFFLDKHLVTVARFRKFIEATSYVTEAEKFGDSGVYNLNEGKWELLKGTTWEYPLGPDKPAAKDDHPVTQVSWNDAVAYCEWAGLRLPTEFEWEYAARGGKNSGEKFSWGNEVFMNGRFMANVWQGDLSTEQGADGFVFTSPVGHYGETGSGLTDMGGNVWEWCQNTYKPYPGGKPFRINPNIKTIRGGSFFYDQAGELSYTVSFRGQNSIETSLFNAGFRCAKSGN